MFDAIALANSCLFQRGEGEDEFDFGDAVNCHGPALPVCCRDQADSILERGQGRLVQVEFDGADVPCALRSIDEP